MGRGEPHRDNHCERLEAEIDHLEKDPQTANKELREMLDLKEELAPELERLKVLVATASTLPRTPYHLPHNSCLKPAKAPLITIGNSGSKRRSPR